MTRQFAVTAACLFGLAVAPAVAGAASPGVVLPNPGDAATRSTTAAEIASGSLSTPNSSRT